MSESDVANSSLAVCKKVLSLHIGNRRGDCVYLDALNDLDALGSPSTRRLTAWREEAPRRPAGSSSRPLTSGTSYTTSKEKPKFKKHSNEEAGRSRGWSGAAFDADGSPSRTVGAPWEDSPVSSPAAPSLAGRWSTSNQWEAQRQHGPVSSGPAPPMKLPPRSK